MASIGVKGQTLVETCITGKARPDLRPMCFHSCRRRQRLQRGCATQEQYLELSSMCPLIEPWTNRDLRWEELHRRTRTPRDPGDR